jgi:thiol-disulfide isomerase/thioredoxin
MTLYLSFFSTSHCHLCESAENILQAVAEQTDIEYQVVEIAESDALLELYGVRIPVIKRLDTQAEIGWPFTAEDLAQFLQ